EIDMIEPLLEQEDRAGVFGRVARQRLKRLPSSVYWAALGSWGIRRFPGSQEDYYGALDRIYRERSHARSPEDGEPESGPSTWDRKIVPAPADFPANPSTKLTMEEASYLRDRIVVSHPRSLFALLVNDGLPAEVEFPWEHPDQARFSAEHRELLKHACIFSEVMHGAAILYNLMLSELRKKADWQNLYRDEFAEWATRNWTEVDSWDLSQFWRVAYDPNHTITQAAMTFVANWVGFVRAGTSELVESAGARALVRSREQRLKGLHSRFTNQRALDQWSGAAGLVRLSYRWRTANQFLFDLQTAFAEPNAANA